MDNYDAHGATPVLIVAREGGARCDARFAVEAFGGRVLGEVAIEASLERMLLLADDALVMVEIEGDDAPDQDRLLDWLDVLARDRGTPAIVSFPTACLDAVAARITAPEILLLCQPTLHDRIAALAVARRPGRSGFVAEEGPAGDAVQLMRLAEEVARIAKAMADLATPGRGGATARALMPPAGPDPDSVRPVAAADIRRMIRLRRSRDRFFPPSLFADPAWDILLDLTAARMEGVRVAASSLCIAAAVPPTTALRLIRTMTAMGLLVRLADPNDGRRVFIDLTHASETAMLGFFASIGATELALV